MSGFSFRQWLTLNEATDLSNMPRTELPDVRGEVERYMKLGGEYSGDTYPVGGELTELAAVAQGRKPVALVQLRATGGHPALMSRRDPQPKKVTDPHNYGLIQKMLIQKVMQKGDHMAVMPLNSMTHGMLAVGEERLVREMVRLYDLQHELTLRSDKKALSDPARKYEILRVLKKKYNAVQKSVCEMGDYGFSCKLLHQEIGRLLGYGEKEVSDFTSNLEDLPKDDHQFRSEIPFSMRTQGGKLQKGTSNTMLADLP